MRTVRDETCSAAVSPVATRAARTGLAAAIERGVAGWDRQRMLPRLVAVGPDELADRSRDGRLAMVRRILAALRGERSRGRAGHWSYSLDRHIGLVQALAAERRALAEIDRAAPRCGATPSASECSASARATARTQTAADDGPRRS